jgi:glycosyltransferase involved in cell wall biosynthesis
LEKSEIAVLIPVYNEEKTILKIIQKVKSFATPVIIDDGSNDDSQNIIKKNVNFYVLNKKNRGYEAALNLGYNYIRKKTSFKYLITFDADGQHKIKDLKRIIYYLKRDYDVVCSKRIKMARISEKIFSFFFDIKFGFKDPLCGMKGYKISKFKKKKKYSIFNTCGTEFLIYATFKNFKIKSFYIEADERIDEPRFGNILFSNLKILKSLIIIFIKQNEIKS